MKLYTQFLSTVIYSVSYVLASSSSSDEVSIQQTQKHLRRNLASAGASHPDDGVLIYEYPAPPGQTLEDLINCMMNQQHTPDPRKDSPHWPGWHSHYTPQEIAEYFLHQQLQQSFRKTDDPSKASIFFVNTSPVISNLADVCNGKNHRDRQLYWKEVIEQSEFFHERPIDHAFICQSWECFNYVIPALKPLVRDMSYLIHENNKAWIGIDKFNMGNTVLIPYVAHSSLNVFTTLPTTDVIRKDKHMVTFCGDLNRRTKLRAVLSNIDGVYISNTSKNNGKNPKDTEILNEYHQVMSNSIFCLVPEGDTPSSRRLFDAMVAGCIPVFISWGYDKPFENIIDYKSFSVHFNAKQWLEGGAQGQIDFLYNMSDEKIKKLRENMAKYVEYINWREGTSVIEGIVDEMLHRRTGKRVVASSRKLFNLSG